MDKSEADEEDEPNDDEVGDALPKLVFVHVDHSMAFASRGSRSAISAMSVALAL